MKNEEKALQLAGLKETPDEEERYYNRSNCKIYDKCLEMAAWKDEQIKDFIDKSVKWWKDNPDDSYGYNPVTCYLRQYKEWAYKEMGIQRKLTDYCTHNIDGSYCELCYDVCDGTACVDYNCCDSEMD